MPPKKKEHESYKEYAARINAAAAKRKKLEQEGFRFPSPDVNIGGQKDPHKDRYED